MINWNCKAQFFGSVIEDCTGYGVIGFFKEQGLETNLYPIGRPRFRVREGWLSGLSGIIGGGAITCRCGRPLRYSTGIAIWLFISARSRVAVKPSVRLARAKLRTDLGR